MSQLVALAGLFLHTFVNPFAAVDAAVESALTQPARPIPTETNYVDFLKENVRNTGFSTDPRRDASQDVLGTEDTTLEVYLINPDTCYLNNDRTRYAIAVRNTSATDQDFVVITLNYPNEALQYYPREGEHGTPSETGDGFARWTVPKIPAGFEVYLVADFTIQVQNGEIETIVDAVHSGNDRVVSQHIIPKSCTDQLGLAGADVFLEALLPNRDPVIICDPAQQVRINFGEDGSSLPPSDTIVDCVDQFPSLGSNWQQVVANTKWEPRICETGNPLYPFHEALFDRPCAPNIPPRGVRFESARPDIITSYFSEPACRVEADDIVITKAYHDGFWRFSKPAVFYLEPVRTAEAEFDSLRLKDDEGNETADGAVTHENELLGIGHFHDVIETYTSLHLTYWNRYIELIDGFQRYHNPTEDNASDTLDEFDSFVDALDTAITDNNTNFLDDYKEKQTEKKAKFDPVKASGVKHAEETMSLGCGIEGSDAGTGGALDAAKGAYEASLDAREAEYPTTQTQSKDDYLAGWDEARSDFEEALNAAVDVGSPEGLKAFSRGIDGGPMSALIQPYKKHQDDDVAADRKVQLENWNEAFVGVKTESTKCQRNALLGREKVEVTFCETGHLSEAILNEAPVPAKARDVATGVRPPEEIRYPEEFPAIDIIGNPPNDGFYPDNPPYIDPKEVYGEACGGRPGDPRWAFDCSCSCDDSVIRFGLYGAPDYIGFCQAIPGQGITIIPKDIDPTIGYSFEDVLGAFSSAAEETEPVQLDLESEAENKGSFLRWILGIKTAHAATDSQITDLDTSLLQGVWHGLQSSFQYLFAAGKVPQDPTPPNSGSDTKGSTKPTRPGSGSGTTKPPIRPGSGSGIGSGSGSGTGAGPSGNVTLNANPKNNIDPGTLVHFNWSVPFTASWCDASASPFDSHWSGTVSSSGNNSWNVWVTTSYSLTCHDVSGNVIDSDSVTVIVKAGTDDPACGASGPACNGTCPFGQSCNKTSGGGCVCQGDPPPPPTCGGSYPACNGTCSPGTSCKNDGRGCRCSSDTPPPSCGGSFPACNGGPCPAGRSCKSTGTSCACILDTGPSCICGNGLCQKQECGENHINCSTDNGGDCRPPKPPPNVWLTVTPEKVNYAIAPSGAQVTVAWGSEDASSCSTSIRATDAGGNPTNNYSAVHVGTGTTWPNHPVVPNTEDSAIYRIIGDQGTTIYFKLSCTNGSSASAEDEVLIQYDIDCTLGAPEFVSKDTDFNISWINDLPIAHSPECNIHQRQVGDNPTGWGSVNTYPLPAKQVEPIAAPHIAGQTAVRDGISEATQFRLSCNAGADSCASYKTVVVTEDAMEVDIFADPEHVTQIDPLTDIGWNNVLPGPGGGTCYWHTWIPGQNPGAGPFYTASPAESGSFPYSMDAAVRHFRMWCTLASDGTTKEDLVTVTMEPDILTVKLLGDGQWPWTESEPLIPDPGQETVELSWENSTQYGTPIKECRATASPHRSDWQFGTPVIRQATGLNPNNDSHTVTLPEYWEIAGGLLSDADVLQPSASRLAQREAPIQGATAEKKAEWNREIQDYSLLAGPDVQSNVHAVLDLLPSDSLFATRAVPFVREAFAQDTETATITVTPNPVGFGQNMEVTVTANYSPPSLCTVYRKKQGNPDSSYADIGKTVAGGNSITTGPTDSNLTFKVECPGSAGVPVIGTQDVTFAGSSETASITATPNPVAEGQGITATVSTTNFASPVTCTVYRKKKSDADSQYAFVDTVQSTGGSVSTGSTNATLTLKVECPGSAGTPVIGTTEVAYAGSTETATITATPNPVGPGQDITATVSTANFASPVTCTVFRKKQGEPDGSYASAGTVQSTGGTVTTGSTDTSLTLKVECPGSGGSPVIGTTTVTFSGTAETASITATPSPVGVGESITATVSTTNFASPVTCTVYRKKQGSPDSSYVNIGTVPSTGGSRVTGPTDTSLTLSVVCPGSAGSPVIGTVNVPFNVGGTVSVSAAPNPVGPGQSITATVNSTGPTTGDCTLYRKKLNDPDSSFVSVGNVPAGGSIVTGPTDTSLTLKAECPTGFAGGSSGQTNVTFQSNETASITAAPNPVGPGQQITATVSTTNLAGAAACTVYRKIASAPDTAYVNIGNTPSSGGSITTGSTTSSLTLKVECPGSGGVPIIGTTTVNYSSNESVNLTAVPNPVGPDQSITVTVTTANLTGAACTISRKLASNPDLDSFYHHVGTVPAGGGSRVTGPTTESLTIRVRCPGSNGVIEKKIHVPFSTDESASITATPNPVGPGQSITATVTTTNLTGAADCTVYRKLKSAPDVPASYANVGTVPSSGGSVVTGSTNASLTLKVECPGSDGNPVVAKKDVTFVDGSDSEVTITHEDGEVVEDIEDIIVHYTTNATVAGDGSCFLSKKNTVGGSYAFIQGVARNGSDSPVNIGTTSIPLTIRIRCTGSYGSAEAEMTVNTAPPDSGPGEVTLSGPDQVNDGDDIVLTYTTNEAVSSSSATCRLEGRTVTGIWNNVTTVANDGSDSPVTAGTMFGTTRLFRIRCTGGGLPETLSNTHVVGSGVTTAEYITQFEFDDGSQTAIIGLGDSIGVVWDAPGATKCDRKYQPDDDGLHNWKTLNGAVAGTRNITLNSQSLYILELACEGPEGIDKRSLLLSTHSIGLTGPSWVPENFDFSLTWTMAEPSEIDSCELFGNDSSLGPIAAAPSGTYDVTGGITVDTSYDLRCTTTSGGSMEVTHDVSISTVDNIPPVAGNQFTATSIDAPKAITLTGSDPDNGPALLTFTVVQQPTNGTLSGTSPNYTYTPNSGFEGHDNIKFTAFDGLDTSTIGGNIDIKVGDPSHVNLSFVEGQDEDASTAAAGELVSVFWDNENVSGIGWSCQASSNPANADPAWDAYTFPDPITGSFLVTIPADADVGDTYDFTMACQKGAKVVSDTVTVTVIEPPDKALIRYTLTCWMEGYPSHPESDDVWVEITEGPCEPPEITITADQTSVPPDTSVHMSYSIENGVTSAVRQSSPPGSVTGWDGAITTPAQLSASGNVTIHGNSILSITASNECGTAFEYVVVNVETSSSPAPSPTTSPKPDPPIVNLSTDRTCVKPNVATDVKVSWNNVNVGDYADHICNKWKIPPGTPAAVVWDGVVPQAQNESGNEIVTVNMPSVGYGPIFLVMDCSTPGGIDVDIVQIHASHECEVPSPAPSPSPTYDCIDCLLDALTPADTAQCYVDYAPTCPQATPTPTYDCIDCLLDALTPADTAQCYIDYAPTCPQATPTPTYDCIDCLLDALTPADTAQCYIDYAPTCPQATPTPTYDCIDCLLNALTPADTAQCYIDYPDCPLPTPTPSPTYDCIDCLLNALTPADTAQCYIDFPDCPLPTPTVTPSPTYDCIDCLLNALTPEDTAQCYVIFPDCPLTTPEPTPTVTPTVPPSPTPSIPIFPEWRPITRHDVYENLASCIQEATKPPDHNTVTEPFGHLRPFRPGPLLYNFPRDAFETR